jgi:hypothetical protein
MITDESGRRREERGQESRKAQERRKCIFSREHNVPGDTMFGTGINICRASEGRELRV